MILAALVNVLPMLEQRIPNGLLCVGRASAELWEAINHVLHEMEAIELIEHHHVERSRGRALFLVAADVQIPVVLPAIGEPVNEPRIAVEGEDDRLIRGKESVEILIA